MNEEIISASGERAAIGGYLPQFDEFAWFVYLNLINNKLEWIRVADPKAEKLYAVAGAFLLQHLSTQNQLSYRKVLLYCSID